MPVYAEEAPKTARQQTTISVMASAENIAGANTTPFPIAPAYVTLIQQLQDMTAEEALQQ